MCFHRNLQFGTDARDYCRSKLATEKAQSSAHIEVRGDRREKREMSKHKFTHFAVVLTIAAIIGRCALLKKVARKKEKGGRKKLTAVTNDR